MRADVTPKQDVAFPAAQTRPGFERPTGERRPAEHAPSPQHLQPPRKPTGALVYRIMKGA